MQRVQQLAAVGFLIVAACLSGGCLAAAAAAGAGATVAYAKGDTERVVSADPPEVVEAARAVLDELAIPVISSESSQIDGVVNGRTAADKKVRVYVEQQTPGVSHVSVRVGTFGDEALSGRILEGITSRLE